ncbi:Metallo-peptidase family M12-domain-containing protein [Blastocladiella britannica]|nr:Metallo-peptidase family M12-domain-containing protein [Blastocladiella britannica]
MFLAPYILLAWLLSVQMALAANLANGIARVESVGAWSFTAPTELSQLDIGELPSTAPKTFDLAFTAFGEKFHFHLEEWHGIHSSLRSRMDSTYLAVVDTSHGASFLFKDGQLISGNFEAKGVTHHVLTGSRYAQQRRKMLDASANAEDDSVGDDFVIYRSSDKTIPSNVTHSCGLDHSGADISASPSLERRSAAAPSSSSSGSCPTSKKIVYVAAAMDCTYIRKYGSVSAAQDQVLSNFLSVSTLYTKQLNVQVGVINIVPFPSCNDTGFNVDCSSPSYDIGNRLSDFSKWTGTLQLTTDMPGAWHLFTGCASGNTIGLAWVSMVCNQYVFSQHNADGSVSYVGATGVTASPSTIPHDTEWLITAHELGHNFGASHDCQLTTDCGATPAICCACSSTTTCNDCPQYDTFIMNPYSQGSLQRFSPCSVAEVCSKMGTLGTCLVEPGAQRVLSKSICGNGMVEDGEQCDCGGVQGCAGNACCNTDCTLKSGAVCDDQSDNCCTKCQITSSAAKQVCRATTGACDRPEMCDGRSKTCPADTFMPNGLPCNLTVTLSSPFVKETAGTCATGVCTTRNQQCLANGGAAVVASANGTLTDSILGECSAMFSGQCSLLCRSSLFGCRRVPGTYLDGTPCGQGGQCHQGACSQPDMIGSIVHWTLKNWIGAIAVGVATALALLSAIQRLCCTCSRRRSVSEGTLKRMRHYYEKPESSMAAPARSSAEVLRSAEL